jgi:glycosyltransferase involved in cell wall biosynthesis
MKLAFASIFNAKDVGQWSGTPYFMTHEFQQNGVEMEYAGPLATRLPLKFKAKQLLKRFTFGKRESARFNIDATKYYAKQVSDYLNNKSVDAIISTQASPLAYLDYPKPKILWTDALFASLVAFYKPSSTLSDISVLEANQVTAACLSRCSLNIFSSDWAAQAAIELYGTAKEKVAVIPFGANLSSSPDLTEIKSIIKKRDHTKIKLLFLGKEWDRKGGDTALEVAYTLHQAGYPVELTIVGCALKLTNLPHFIKHIKYISKQTEEGQKQIYQLFCDSHFLLLPSRAEAFGIVFCEASAFGVPSLTTHVGGISTVVKDGINGFTFSLEASSQDYCRHIIHLFNHYHEYESLALSSFNEYITRLNWNSSIKQAVALISERI